MATPGSLLPGGFVLGRLSHADRVGLVYRAHHAENKDARAASALVLHPLHVEELREWFEKMAVLGRSLRHPNLIEVYALGYTANELPVVVTEWVEGKTTRNELASGRVFPPAEVSRIVREVASALDYLHRRTPPVLHRVIMPETVLLSTPSGTVKLLAVGHADRPQHPAAKPSYQSPEELSGENGLSPASDVFSLASFTYEILTGSVAFTGNAHGILAAIYRGAYPHVAASEGATEVEAVLHRAWSPDASRRFQSAGAFVESLAGALEHLSGVVTSGRRSVSAGPMRAPTFPAPSTGASVGPGPVVAAPVQSPTGRFAAASFHADALRSSRPFVPATRASTNGQWSSPPNPSAASPLLMSAGAVAVNTQAARPSAQRSSGVQPSASWNSPPASNHPTVGEAHGLDIEEMTVAARKDRDSYDEEFLTGRLDDALQRSPRLIDDEMVIAAAPPAAPRKDPLFMPSPATDGGSGRPYDPGSAGMRRNTGEFTPAQRRNTGEFPPAPIQSRNTGEFAPAPIQSRNTGEFAPAPIQSRSTGEFAPAPIQSRSTGEFAAAGVHVHRGTTGANIIARRASENPSPPSQHPPRRLQTGSSQVVVATPSLNAVNAPSDVPRPGPRTPFETDAFAPAAQKSDRPDQPRAWGEVRFSWPVLVGIIVGNTLLTLIVVLGFNHLMSQRAPTIVYMTPPEHRNADPASPQVGEAPSNRFDPHGPATPVDMNPGRLNAQPPAAPPFLPPEPPVAPPPEVPAPRAPPIVVPWHEPAPRPAAAHENLPWRERNRLRQIRAAAVPVPAVVAPRPVAVPVPAPVPAPRPASSGFGEPPPNPY